MTKIHSPVERSHDFFHLLQELTALLRSMGQNPTDSEVQHMINQVDIDGSGAVDFDEFCHFMVKLMKSNDPENEAKEAYRS